MTRVVPFRVNKDRNSLLGFKHDFSQLIPLELFISMQLLGIYFSLACEQAKLFFARTLDKHPRVWGKSL